MSKEEVKSLKVIVNFIVTNYCPPWFSTKQNDSLGHGPEHLYSQIKALRFLKGKVLESARENVVRISYYAHSELLLTYMLTDRDLKIREQGVDKIKALRQGSDVGDKSVCPFKVPIVNLDYIFYIDMLDWDQESVTEPILTTNMSLHELDSLKDSPLKLDK